MVLSDVFPLILSLKCAVLQKQTTPAQMCGPDSFNVVRDSSRVGFRGSLLAAFPTDQPHLPPSQATMSVALPPRQLNEMCVVFGSHVASTVLLVPRRGLEPPRGYPH